MIMQQFPQLKKVLIGRAMDLQILQHFLYPEQAPEARRVDIEGLLKRFCKAPVDADVQALLLEFYEQPAAEE